MARINPDGTMPTTTRSGRRTRGWRQRLREIIKNRKEDNHEGK